MKQTMSRAAVLLAIVVGLAGCRTAYNKITVEKLKTVVGDDFKSYRWFSYPTDNLDIGTAYASADRFKQQISICDSAACFAVAPASFQEWLTLGGFAGAGNNGATVTLSETEQRQLSGELDGVKIAQLVELGGGVDYTKGVTTKVRLGKAYPRRLRLQPTLEYISRLDSQQLVKQAFDAGTLVLIASDLVMEGVSVDLCVDKTVNPQLSARLDEKVGTVIGKDAAVAVNVVSANSGCYTLEAQKPIVVAALALEQPAAGALSVSSQDEWQGWKKHMLLDVNLAGPQ